MAFHDNSPQFLLEMDRAFHANDPNVLTKRLEADNVQRIRDAYHGLVSPNSNAFADLFHDDVSAEIHGPPGAPICGSWQGKRDFLEAVGRNFSLFDDQNPVLDDIVAQGDVVVVFARETGRFLPNGMSYDVRWIHHFHFRDGKVAQFREYFLGEGPWD